MLLLNYAMNPTHSIFGHQFEIVNNISDSFESVTVITTEYIGDKLPENVKVYLAPWKSNSKILSVVKFYRTLILVLFKKRYDLVFSHMVDTQAFMAVPLLKIQKIPHIFFNGNTSFDSIPIQNRYNWGTSYIEPYNKAGTYTSVLQNNGHQTVAPDSYHFGKEAHSFWANYVLQYIVRNQLI